MHDSSNCPVCRGQPRDGSLTDEQFFDFVQACRDELAVKQERFLARIADASRWQCELANGTLSFDDESFPVTPVGTHSDEQQTWLWAWANETLPGLARQASRRIQALHDRTGFRVFLDEGTPAKSIDAQDLTALAIHELDAIGLYRVPSEGGPTLYLAVHEPLGSPDAGARDL
jgi:hypothetical protein